MAKVALALYVAAMVAYATYCYKEAISFLFLGHSVMLCGMCYRVGKES